MRQSLIIAALTIGLSSSAVATQQEQDDAEFYNLKLTVSELSKGKVIWKSTRNAEIGCGKAFEDKLTYSLGGDEEQNQIMACSSFSTSDTHRRQDGKHSGGAIVFIPKDERTLITGSELIHVYYASSECGTIQFEVPWLARGDIKKKETNSDGSCLLELDVTSAQS